MTPAASPAGDEISGLCPAFAGQLDLYPAGYTFMLLAWEYALGPVTEIVIAGSRDNAETNCMLKSVQKEFLPRAVLIFRPLEVAEKIERLLPLVRQMRPKKNQPTAYVCQDYAPGTDP